MLATAPYDLTPYSKIWDCPQASVDRRHLFWLYDVLASGLFHNALEIGCLNGASSTAFVEALNQQAVEHATFCDIDLRPSLFDVLQRCHVRERIRTFGGRSADLLRDRCEFDFVFVDGDHRLETVREEVELLLRTKPVCVMAHDTSADPAGFDHCEGPMYLKWRFQTTPPYLCLEENARRAAEQTCRGMFLATTSADVFRHAQSSLLKWGGLS